MRIKLIVQNRFGKDFLILHRLKIGSQIDLFADQSELFADIVTVKFYRTFRHMKQIRYFFCNFILFE